MWAGCIVRYDSPVEQDLLQVLDGHHVLLPDVQQLHGNCIIPVQLPHTQIMEAQLQVCSNWGGQSKWVKYSGHYTSQHSPGETFLQSLSKIS